MRVKIIVLNSVLHDARVIKEANSLAGAGHDVSVIGLFDKRSTGTDHRLASGVRIHLCQPPLDQVTHIIVRYARLVIFSFIVAVFLLLLNSPFGAGLLALVNTSVIQKLFLVLSLLIAGAFSVYFIIRRTSFHNTSIGWLPNDFKLTFFELGKRINKALRVLFRRIARPVYSKIRQQYLVEAALRGGVDVIHCHDLWSLPSGIEVKRKSGAPLVWDAHEIYEEVAQGDKRHALMCRKLMRRYQRDIDYFITINESIASFYKEHYPALPQATIIKNATQYIPGISSDGRLHQAAKLPLSQKIALYQGGFAEKRGLHALVQAAAHLHADWTLVMMGWGKLEQELKRLATDMVVENSTRTTPAIVFLSAVPQSELVHWTAGGTVGLIPYENVGLNHLYCTPNKLWEYPAAGVPVLCSPLVEMSKTIQQYNTGWLLPTSTEPISIAHIINGLTLYDIDNAKEACAEFIKSDNWAVYGGRVVELYEVIAKTMISPAIGPKDILHRS